jgi:hypothetical protein
MLELGTIAGDMAVTPTPGGAPPGRRR